MTGLSLSLHALAAVIWVGGMFFAYMAMRPAVVRVVDPSQRPLLWCHTLSLFFRWVWASVALLLVTGYGLIHLYGGMGQVNWHIHVMHGLAIVMLVIFVALVHGPWGRFRRAREAGDAGAAAAALGGIRRLVALNLTLGLVTAVLGASGRWWGAS